jgi:predicted transcriptional regulator
MANLTKMHMQALGLLYQGAQPAEIAAKLALDTAMAATIVQDLAEVGLVREALDPLSRMGTVGTPASNPRPSRSIAPHSKTPATASR